MSLRRAITSDTRAAVTDAVLQLRGVRPEDCRPSLIARALVGSVTKVTRPVRTLPCYGRLKPLMSKGEVQSLIECVRTAAQRHYVRNTAVSLGAPPPGCFVLPIVSCPFCPCSHPWPQRHDRLW